MSKLMWLLGILLIAAGVALGVKGYMSPGQLDVLGLRLDTAAQLVVGGILSLGLGSVVDGLAQLRGAAPRPASVIATVGEEKVETPDTEDTPVKIPGFGRNRLEAAGAAAAASAAVAVTAAAETKSVINSIAPVPTGSVADTIAALEQAKSDIKNALGGVESMGTPPENLHPVHAVPTEAPRAEAVIEAPVEEGELYVVEEKIIRGRPSRILSDDTVEAETDEGWMRFENLEHLNEYLDSTDAGDA
jgi:hypothetical protein